MPPSQFQIARLANRRGRAGRPRDAQRAPHVARGGGPKVYREVQLDFTPEMEIFFMLFGRCHTKNQKRSLKRHIKHFNFRSKIQLDHPVQRPSPPRRPRSPFTMTLSAATTSTTTLRTMTMTDHSMSGKRETVRGVASHPRRLL